MRLPQQMIHESHARTDSQEPRGTELRVRAAHRWLQVRPMSAWKSRASTEEEAGMPRVQGTRYAGHH